jgi:hypothetical protein
MTIALNKYTGVNEEAQTIDIIFKYGKPTKGTGDISYLTKTVTLNLNTSISNLYRIAGVISSTYPEHLKLVLEGRELDNKNSVQKQRPLADFTSAQSLDMTIQPKLRGGPSQNWVIKEQQELNAKYSDPIEKSITAIIKKQYNITGGKRKTRRNRKNNRKTLRSRK